MFPPNNILNVYKIDSIRTPFHTSDGNHPNKSSILTGTHDFVAFSRDMATFGFLSRDYTDCQSSDFTCDKPGIMLNQPSHDCVSNLFVNLKIAPSCRFETSTKEPLPNALMVGKSFPVRVSCYGKPDTFYRINSHTILDISCGCSIHTDHFSIDSDLTSCQHGHDPVKITYPINIAQFRSINMPTFSNLTTDAKQVVI